MRRLYEGDELPAACRGGVVALGNFDGFHLGHQAVVERAIAAARAAGRPAIVATFDPHPARYFRPDLPPFTITTLVQKLRLFEAFGVDVVIVRRFDEALANTGAVDFVEHWLVGTLGARTVVTGANFAFGHGRDGDPALLAAFGRRFGLEAVAVPAVEALGEPVSSSRIRRLLEAGDCRTAARLLTRPFTIEGEVAHGDKRGRVLGFPTANVALGEYLRPAFGVYAVRARRASGQSFAGVANLGVRPMFDPPKELLEVHLFDFEGDLYGETIAVELVDYLRPELRLDGLDALCRQIALDCAEARVRLQLLEA